MRQSAASARRWGLGPRFAAWANWGRGGSFSGRLVVHRRTARNRQAGASSLTVRAFSSRCGVPATNRPSF